MLYVQSEGDEEGVRNKGEIDRKSEWEIDKNRAKERKRGQERKREAKIEREKKGEEEIQTRRNGN